LSQLIFGDCLDLLPSLETDSVDLILTDLPYGTTRNSWDFIIDPERLWPELLRVAKRHAPIVMTAQMPFTAALMMSQPKLFRHHWIWEKTSATGHLNAKRAPMKAHEDVLVFSQGAPVYNPQKTAGHARKVSTAEHKRGSKKTTNWGVHGLSSYDSTERYPRTVQKFASDKQKSKLHATQKPVALFEYLMKTYSNPGDLVLDVAAGSATTGIAAQNTGREYILFENDPEIFEPAARRLRDNA
jgi:DNA modification methylase